MQDAPNDTSSAMSRRRFLKHSTIAASAAGTGLLAGCARHAKSAAVATAAVTAPAVVKAQAKPPINAVIIGLGGRGSGAGRDFTEAAKAAGVEGKIVGVADIFPEATRKGAETFSVPEDKAFSGFDGYQKVLALPGVNYAILATPPGFRAVHFKAAVEAGKHVFTEKPVAVDGPGARMMYAAAELSKQKGLKVAAGTQRRHQTPYIETIKRIKGGEIGDVVTLRAYWVNGGPIWHRGDKGDTELERQVRNWYHYIWLCGDHICEQHVHNIDVCNWIVGDHPVKCWGMGARQQLNGKSGEIWDNFAVEYEYANGVRMYSYCGQIKREWSSVSEGVQGTKGTSDPGGRIQPKEGQMWRYRKQEKDVSPYVQEHIDLINAIANGTELNEAKQVTDSTLTAIMGREAAYSGAGVEWDTVLNSTFAYGPELLYKDCASMQWGPFRVLQPPMPSEHNIFKSPPVLQVAKA
jgi:myo-inositol 2-dehydrogenase / D-chiro-inositol 1-dehydrogenase